MSIRISDRSVTRNIEDLSTDFYVRRQLNTDWAMEIALLLEGGVELEPIFITRDNKVIDGRHRMEAHELNKLGEIRCKIVEADTEIELIVFAMKCNMGGSMPPTKHDFEHMIELLLNRGVPKKDIVERVDILPGKLVRKFLSEIESRLKRAKLAKAATAVAEGGLTVGKAAENFGVLETDLRTMLKGKVAKKQKGGVPEFKRGLSNHFRGKGKKTASVIQNLFEEYQDGTISHRDVLGIFKHIDHLLKSEARRIAGWRSRFDAMEAPKKLIA